MSVSITDRLTAAIRIADQSVEQAQYLGDRNNWLEVRRVMQDARDEIGKPQHIPAFLAPAAEPAKIDGRTKEARAAKQANAA